jgi:hypothetical protein
MITGLPTKQFIAAISDMLRQGGSRFRKRDYVYQRHQFKLDAGHVAVIDVFISKSTPVAWMNSYILCLEHGCTSKMDSTQEKAAAQWSREIREPLLKDGSLIINCCQMGEWTSLVPEKFHSEGGQP